MNRYLSAFLLSLACTLVFPACTQFQQQQDSTAPGQEATPDIPPPLYLGTVHQVFSADKFALLRLIGPIPPEGTVLISHPADGTTDRVGNLVVSAAQNARNGIIAADIRAGLVLKGDRIFKYRSISAAEEEEETEENPEPVSLTGVELDVGYTPPEIKEELEGNTKPEPADQPAPASSYTETTVLPDDEPVAPAIPDTPGNSKFDDIPDTIGGWDSF